VLHFYFVVFGDQLKIVEISTEGCTGAIDINH